MISSQFDQLYLQSRQQNNDYGYLADQFVMKSYQQLLLSQQIHKSAEFVSLLKKNVSKIESLIQQNDRLKKLNSLQLKTIEIHLKKQIDIKLTILNLQHQIDQLNKRLLYQKHQSIKHQDEVRFVQNEKQLYKLTQKLINCKDENSLLRIQNKKLSEQLRNQQQNVKHLQQSNKKTIKQLKQQIFILQNDLIQQKQKTLSYQRILIQNNQLKRQNRTMSHKVQKELESYSIKIQKLMQQMERQKVSKQIYQEKYQQLTQVISIVDKMRFQFKVKKNQIQRNQQIHHTHQSLQKNHKSILKQTFIHNKQKHFISDVENFNSTKKNKTSKKKTIANGN